MDVGSSPSSLIMAIKSENVNKLYITLEQLFKAGHYGIVDTLLSSADIEKLDQDMMLLYLDATLHEKSKLKQREIFYEKCNQELLKRNEKKNRRFERLA